jgi:hypothetical protein
VVRRRAAHRDEHEVVDADAGHYNMLVGGRGWPLEKFRRWLADAMQSQLLRPRRRRPTHSKARTKTSG